MAHQIRVVNAQTQLPTGTYAANTVVTLTDAQFAQLQPVEFTNGNLVDLGPVFSLGHSVTAVAAQVDLPNGVTLAAGQTIILDDKTFSQLGPNVFTDSTLTDGGAVLAAQAPTVGAVRTFAAHAACATIEAVVKCDATGGAFTQNLPVTPIIGRHYVVIKIDASGNAITVAPSAGTGTINGASTQTLAAQYNNLDFVWDGTNWFIST